MTAKSTLLNWLAEDDLKKVLQGLDFLANKYQNEQLRNDTAVQSGRFKTLEEQRTKHSIAVEDERMEVASIKQALLQISQGISNEWSLDELAIAPNKILAMLKTHRKKIYIIAGAIAVLANIAQFTGYSARDFSKQNEPVEKTVKKEPPAPKASTTGDNSPAIITREGDVNVNYGDSNAKKDSAHK